MNTQTSLNTLWIYWWDTLLYSTLNKLVTNYMFSHVYFGLQMQHICLYLNLRKNKHAFRF